VTPRTFPPAPGWSPDGHRIKAPLEYRRGDEKVWVDGALRERDGQAITLTTRARNTAGYRQLLDAVDAANPDGELSLITDNLSSRVPPGRSPPIVCWLAAHPRVQQVFLPKGAGWLNLQEAWWRLFRKEALAGQTFADGEELDRATTVATRQLNRRAGPWIWGRPPRPKRWKRRCLVYRV
jgi:DDE superfamily endonuclease